MAKKRAKRGPRKPKQKKDKKFLENLFLERLLEMFPDLPPPEREFKFHRRRKWRFDFAWVDLKIAVEIQGGAFQFRGGRGGRGSGGHNTAMGQSKDYEKYRIATRGGWRIFPYNTHDLQEKYNEKHRKKVLKDHILFMGEYIEREIKRARKTNNR